MKWTTSAVINVTSLLRHSLLINMLFTNEDKVSIKKKWGAKRMCKEFSKSKWAVSSVRDLLHKIDTRTRSLGRPVADDWGQSEQNRISSVLLNWYAVRETTLGPAKVPEILKSWQEYPTVLCGESLREINIMSSDARRHTCCLILIVRNVLNAARRCWVGDAYKLLTKCEFLMRKLSLYSYQLTLRMIDYTLQRTRSQPCQVNVSSKVARTSVKAWSYRLQYPRQTRRKHTSSTKEPRTLLPWKSVAELFSSVRNPVATSYFKKMVLRRTVRSGQLSFCSRTLPTSLSFLSGHQTVQIWILLTMLFETLYSKLCTEFRSWMWMISRTECAPVGPASTNNSSAKPLIIGDCD